jgi:hypothetical protein
MTWLSGGVLDIPFIRLQVIWYFHRVHDAPLIPSTQAEITNFGEGVTMDARWLGAAFPLTTILIFLNRSAGSATAGEGHWAFAGLFMRLNWLLLRTDVLIRYIGRLAIVEQFSYSGGLVLPVEEDTGKANLVGVEKV